MSARITAWGVVLAAGLLFLPTLAWAQASSIAGVVRDTTGGVLPGVTVEAASPALIEKVRVAVSDDQGQYRIVDLRPGTYTVTFTLTGFSAFRREGIVLTTGFTAAVNAEMRVGALEETVTVTGASPVVDVQNVRTQNVLSRDVLDALPTGKTVQGFAALTVGASLQGLGGNMHDVGGNRGEQYGSILIHGSRQLDSRLTFDGMRYNNMFNQGGGQARVWYPNQVAIQEVVIETTGMNAEHETGGVLQNSVSKDGGNIFRVHVIGNGTNENLQQSNLTDQLRDRGLSVAVKIRRVYDFGAGLGGPIKRDRLWFYTAHRWWGNQEYYANIFYNKTQGTPVYTPDFSRPGNTDSHQKDHSLRLTWQAAPKHKFTASFSNQQNCQCGFQGGTSAPEATTHFWASPQYLAIATWTYPATNRLLFEAGGALMHAIYSPQLAPGRTRADVSMLEFSTALTYNVTTSGLSSSGLGGLPPIGQRGNDYSQHNERFSVSYITGTHAFKTGIFTLFGTDDYPYIGNPLTPYAYRFNFGVPVQLMQAAMPAGARQRVRNLGMYVQDQWTIRKLTLNLGVRYDNVRGIIPDQVRPAGPFLPEFPVARIENVPNFKDLSPRLGAAYDLFGNGKTAVKVFLGRYVAAIAGEFVERFNPSNQIVQSANRTWTDLNGDFKHDCDLRNIEANGECGALDNRSFGKVVPQSRYAKDVLEGWGNREYTWQASATVQQELRPGIGLTVGYFRTWFGNFLAIDNVAVTKADFDPFCVTAPLDSRLPGGGGYQICDGLGEIKPEKFGLIDYLVTQASHFGDPSEVYNGVDVTFNARFSGGRLLQGGVNVGHTVRECVGQRFTTNLPQWEVDRPVQHCGNAPPFFLPQFKLAGVYPLPIWDLQASATFQALPGLPIGDRSLQRETVANRVYTSAEIKPSLGRDLSAGARGTYIVELFDPNTYFEDRINQLDIRLSKIFRLGRTRLQGMLDIYNIFNDSAVLGQNLRYGAAYLRPTQVMGARLVKFGGQLDF